jgi:enamine deaminase RidA (YjgF/YER057c/UK114 family)
MTCENDSVSMRQQSASRREFVTAVTAAAAASTAVAPASAQAQVGTNVRHSNPPGMTQPAAYSQVVEINGPHRLIFVAGQTGVDASGKAAQGFRAQAVQAFTNIKTALASVGGSMDHVVRLTTYLTDIQQDADAYREVRASFLPNKSALPASTLLQVVRLADPSYLIEVDAIAILPPAK